MTLAGALTLLSTSVGCGLGGDSLSLRAKLVDTGSGLAASQMRSVDLIRSFLAGPSSRLFSLVEDPVSSELKGVYFGELEIVAYDYRPGESVQANSSWGSGSDWSYWVVVQSGHDAARDYVLPVGGSLEFS